MQDRLFRKVALERAASPEKLDALMTVTQPRGWLMLALVAVFIVALGIWSVTADIRLTVDGNGVLVQQDQTLQAVLYFRADQLQNVTPGLPVLIAPVSISTEQYGYLRGQVISIDAQPSASGGSTSISDATPTVFAVHIELQPDNTTPTGFAWTIAKGPGTVLRPTTALIGSIVVSDVHPISRLLPSF